MTELFQKNCEIFNDRGYERILINSLFNQLTLQIPEDAFWELEGNRLKIVLHREMAEGYATVIGSDCKNLHQLHNRRLTFQGGKITEVSHLDTQAFLAEHFTEKHLNRVAGFFLEDMETHMHMGFIMGGVDRKGFSNGEGMSDGIFLMKGGNLCPSTLHLYLDMADVRVDAVKPGGKIEALLRGRNWVL